MTDDHGSRSPPPPSRRHRNNKNSSRRNKTRPNMRNRTTHTMIISSTSTSTKDVAGLRALAALAAVVVAYFPGRRRRPGRRPSGGVGRLRVKSARASPLAPAPGGASMPLVSRPGCAMARRRPSQVLPGLQNEASKALFLPFTRRRELMSPDLAKPNEEEQARHCDFWCCCFSLCEL